MILINFKKTPKTLEEKANHEKELDHESTNESSANVNESSINISVSRNSISENTNEEFNETNSKNEESTDVNNLTKNRNSPFKDSPFIFDVILQACNNYDFNPSPTEKSISVTTLVSNNIKDLVTSLGNFPKEPLAESARIKAAVGTLIHSGVEHALKDPEKIRSVLDNMGLLNYDFDVVQEKRSEKAIKIPSIDETYNISGKFDIVINNEVYDIKSTSTFILNGCQDEKYRLQMSFYKWLNPDLIQGNIGHILAYFRDYRNLSAKYVESFNSKNQYPYPPVDVAQLDYELYDQDYVEAFAKHVITFGTYLVDAVKLKFLSLDDLPEWNGFNYEVYFNKESGKAYFVNTKTAKLENIALEFQSNYPSFIDKITDKELHDSLTSLFL